jgi:hypothetical protein
MQLATMLETRKQLAALGYDDAFIKDVIRARVANSPRNSNRRNHATKSPVGYVCPQQRIDNAVAKATPKRSNHYVGPRGLIMVGEW